MRNITRRRIVRGPGRPRPAPGPGTLPFPLTFFLSGDERAWVLDRLREFGPDRARALMRAIRRAGGTRRGRGPGRSEGVRG